MNLNSEGGSGSWGCLLLVTILLVGLACVGATYLDDWIGIQTSKAQTALHRAQAEQARAEAARQRAESVRDITLAVRARSSVVDLLPWLPVIALIILAAPAMLLAAWGMRQD